MFSKAAGGGVSAVDTIWFADVEGYRLWGKWLVLPAQLKPAVTGSVTHLTQYESPSCGINSGDCLSLCGLQQLAPPLEFRYKPLTVFTRNSGRSCVCCIAVIRRAGEDS